jgi:hypothetical protein
MHRRTLAPHEQIGTQYCRRNDGRHVDFDRERGIEKRFKRRG